MHVSGMRDILAWALTTEILGLAVLPMLRAYFGNRRDAALLSRPLGLAIVAYLGWALTLLLNPPGFRRVMLIIVVLGVAGGSFLARRRNADEGSAIRAPIWGDEEKLAAILFWASTGVLLLIRAVGPAVVGAEKFMDLAFLNSLARYPAMPPADPWMSGATINYYYWGYLLAAAQAKLSGVPPLTAYNLSIASFTGFSFVSAACVGLRLSRGDLKVGLASGGLTVFAGNLTGAFDAWTNPFAVDFDYWHASRVIGPEQFKTINEFPFFTFFHADLHPHLLAFPYFIAAFAVAHRWLEAGRPGTKRAWLWILLVALVCGTARAANFWNLPAMAILLVVAGALRPTRGERWPRLPAAFGGAFTGAAVLLLSLVLFYEYSRSFQLENRGLGRATMHSGVFELLGVWGILFAVCAAGLWPRPLSVEALPGVGAGADAESARRRRDLILSAVAGASLVAGFLMKMPAIPLLLFLLVLAGLSTWRSLRSEPSDPDGVFAGFLVLLGLGMIAGCELVYHQDTYGQDLQRMNTIFKYYHQAWPLLAIGGSVFAGRAWNAAPARRRPLWRLGLSVLAVLALLWPLNVAISRYRQKDGPISLDLGGPLAKRSPGDAAAVAWLLKNAPIGSKILEASGDPYTEYARISSHTGVPTVLGWANHELLWRSDDAQVQERLSRVRHFYTAADPRIAWDTINKYGVTYVVVGDMERRTYPKADAVGTFPFLKPVLTGDTTIYAVQRPDGE
jgi:YYY domain-containing protein